jgi:hypothetical protein
MALIFSRLARNFIKAGYFPTDEVTLQRIGQMLKLPPTGLVRMIDPCCGEGTAIADLRHMLAAQKEEGVTATTEALGIELDSERAWHAKKLLDRVLHTDIHDAVVKPRSMGLLFSIHPMGTVSRIKQASESCMPMPRKLSAWSGRSCAKQCHLAYGGVLVYIVPHYALDEEIRSYLVRNFQNLRVFMAPERQFKQCVIVGTRCKPVLCAERRTAVPDRSAGLARGRADASRLMGRSSLRRLQQVDQELDFHAVRIDEEQLRDELRKYQHMTLWTGLQGHFAQSVGHAGHRCVTSRPGTLPLHWLLARSSARSDLQGGEPFSSKVTPSNARSAKSRLTSTTRATRARRQSCSTALFQLSTRLS